MKNKILKTILQILAVPFFSFILLNLIFVFDAIYQGFLRQLILNPSVVAAMVIKGNWLPMAIHGSFLLIICLISWPILRSKLNTLIKAIYLTVPSAVVFVTVGIFLNRWPIIEYPIEGIIGFGIFYYLYTRKKPWLYYYSIALIGITLLIMAILKVDI